MIVAVLQPGVLQLLKALHFFRHQSHRLCVHLLSLRQVTGVIYAVTVPCIVTHPIGSAALRVCFSGNSR